MNKSLRILHVPGRTPYSRKLHGGNISIVNETKGSGIPVPRDTSFEWIEKQTSFDFFDVLHIQSLELTRIGSIEKVLERCAAGHKGVVITIHDLGPLFPDDKNDFVERVRLACRFATGVVTLTKRAGEEISRLFGVDAARVKVVPHGPVLPISHPLWARKSHRNSCFSLGMFGGFRPNRTFLTPAVNALHGLDSLDVRVHILSRGLNPIELAPDSEALQVISLASADTRLSLRLLPFPSDDEIADFVHSLDVLVLPYLYGTHSGQLELAMDLGVPVVAPDIGCYREQWRLHTDTIREPFWFDYNPTEPYSYGAPLLRAMRSAHENWKQQENKSGKSSFLAIRTREQNDILNAHADLYARAMP